MVGAVQAVHQVFDGCDPLYGAGVKVSEWRVGVDEQDGFWVLVEGGVVGHLKMRSICDLRSCPRFVAKQNQVTAVRRLANRSHIPGRPGGLPRTAAITLPTGNQGNRASKLLRVCDGGSPNPVADVQRRGES